MLSGIAYPLHKCKTCEENQTNSYFIPCAQNGDSSDSWLKTKFEVVEGTIFESSPIMVPPSWNRKSNLAYESSDLRSGWKLDFGIQNCRGDFGMKFVAPSGPGGAEVKVGFFRDFCNPEQFLKITRTCIPNCLFRKSGCFLHDKKSRKKPTSWCHNVWRL